MLRIPLTSMAVTLTLLGTGTSQGVPVITCDCTVCASADVMDKRLRTSAMYEVSCESNSSDVRRFIVDTGPDFRQQMLREKVSNVDAVLFTHEHKDHVAGLDDVRAFNFKQKSAIDLYASERVQEALNREFHYAFSGEGYPGIPQLEMHTITDAPFTVAGVEVTPIPVRHLNLPVVGFRIEDVAYITDASHLTPEAWERLQGLDVLVINALRKKAHISHFNLEQALRVIEELKPSRAYLTHISHLMGLHAEVSQELPDGVQLGYDGLVIHSDGLQSSQPSAL